MAKKWCLNLQDVEFPSISDNDNRILVKEIDEKEIEEEISQYDETKSSKPSGFNFYFIKNNWDTIKNEVY